MPETARALADSGDEVLAAFEEELARTRPSGASRPSAARQTRVLGALEALAGALESGDLAGAYRDAEWEGFRHGASGQPGDAPVTEALALRRAVDRVLGPILARGRPSGGPWSARWTGWPCGSPPATPTVSAAGSGRRSSDVRVRGERDAHRRPDPPVRGPLAVRLRRGARARGEPQHAAPVGQRGARARTSAPRAATAASTRRRCASGWPASPPARPRPARQGPVQIPVAPMLAEALRGCADRVSDAGGGPRRGPRRGRLPAAAPARAPRRGARVGGRPRRRLPDRQPRRRPRARRDLRPRPRPGRVVGRGHPRRQPRAGARDRPRPGGPAAAAARRRSAARWSPR